MISLDGTRGDCVLYSVCLCEEQTQATELVQYADEPVRNTKLQQASVSAVARAREVVGKE